MTATIEEWKDLKAKESEGKYLELLKIIKKQEQVFDNLLSALIKKGVIEQDEIPKIYGLK